MDSRQRREHWNETGSPASAGRGPRSGNRERGNSLLAAADEAITRALSRDSRQFLADVEQEGGE
jgi:hypothetical protein